jgi:hypothetical protein
MLQPWRSAKRAGATCDVALRADQSQKDPGGWWGGADQIDRDKIEVPVLYSALFCDFTGN